MQKTTWEYSFKWKPPEYNTNDFLVSTKKDKQGKDVSKVNIGFEGEISDETGNCHFVRWYGDYKNSFKRGSIIMMIGKKNEFGGKIQINLPSQSEIIGDPKYPSQWEKIGVSTPFKLLAI